MTQDVLLGNLAELRKRLLYSVALFFPLFLLSYLYASSLFNFLARPLFDLDPGLHLIYTGLPEAFLTYIRLSLWAAFFFSFPWFLIQLWVFLVPALYEYEKGVFLSFFCLSPLLLFLGGWFSYTFVLPKAYAFFMSFETLTLRPDLKMDQYLSFTMRFLLAFGVGFQLPIVLGILAWMGKLSAEELKRHWRFAVVGIFTISALITPPDLLSMIALGIPLILLYVLSIVMIAIMEKKNDRFKADS